MVVVLEQDFELLVTVFVPVLCLDLFDERGEDGRVVLLSVVGRGVCQSALAMSSVLKVGSATFSQARSRISSSLPPLRKTLRTPQLQQRSIKSPDMSTAKRTMV